MFLFPVLFLSFLKESSSDRSWQCLVLLVSMVFFFLFGFFFSFFAFYFYFIRGDQEYCTYLFETGVNLFVGY